MRARSVPQAVDRTGGPMFGTRILVALAVFSFFLIA
jgi:hypothetical protein